MDESIVYEPPEQFTERILHLADRLREKGITSSKRNNSIRYRRMRLYPLSVVENKRHDGYFELSDTLDGVLYTMFTEDDVVDYIVSTVALENNKDYRDSVFAAQIKHDEDIHKMYEVIE